MKRLFIKLALSFWIPFFIMFLGEVLGVKGEELGGFCVAISVILIFYFTGKFLYENYPTQLKTILGWNWHTLYKKYREEQKLKKEELSRKNPLINMNTKELKNRAYAELISKNYVLSIQFCNELVRRERGDYKVINMRAQCYLELNDLTSALGDAIASVEMQSDINLNEEGYRIRNLLTQGA